MHHCEASRRVTGSTGNVAPVATVSRLAASNAARAALCLLLAACFFSFPSQASEKNDTPLRIVMLGDTHFGENYFYDKASKGIQSPLRASGYDRMLESFAAFLSAADYTVANLETPITARYPSPLAKSDKRYIHNADVEETPKVLAKYGFDLVTLANNHGMDYGLAGLEQTVDLLVAHGIDSCGAGPDLAAAKRPHVQRFDIGGQSIHVAFLCMFDYSDVYEEEFSFYADAERGGINPISVDSIRRIVDDLRRSYENVFVIAFPHWGRNYYWASDAQRDKARAMIDRGVDLIVGHGAHLFQEIELYRDRWIVFNLGNFVFGALSRYQGMDRKYGWIAPFLRQLPLERYRLKAWHPYGLMAVLCLTPSGGKIEKTVRLYPIFTDNRATDYRSRFVTETQFEEVWTLLRDRSDSLDRFDALVIPGSDEHGPFLELATEPSG